MVWDGKICMLGKYSLELMSSDIDLKLHVYKTLVKRLKKEQVRPELISVEFVNAPFYRLER
jgi:hypothetical protein